MQNNLDTLEERRFTPNPESLKKMIALKNHLKVIQKEFPQVVGIGFFGSRTLGRERQQPENPSDLDTTVFYDGSKFLLKDKDKAEISLSTGLKFQNGQVIVAKDAMAAKHKIDAERAEFMRSIRSKISTQMADLALPIDVIETEDSLPHNSSGKDKTVIIIDISQKATDKDINDFIATIAYAPETIDDTRWRLVSRFFLSAGAGLYKNRKYILDKLKDTPQGDLYFQKIMHYLEMIERTRKTEKRDPLPAFQNLPKNIEEARTYFNPSS